jgi:uncharacterized membrane protein SpoIIM required for sporulation
LNKLDQSRLNGAEGAEFSRLFRELCHDLAVIRSRDWGRGLVSYLNGLVARGHNAFYSAPPGSLSQFLQFLTAGFPRTFRRNFGYFVIAAALFFGSLGVSWAVIQWKPPLVARVLPSETLEQLDLMYGDRPLEEFDAEGEDSEPAGGFGEERAGMAGFYVQHNVGIALECFSRGVLLGIGTIYALLYNGIAIGAMTGYVASQGYSERFFSFVVSHGSFELTAIAIAGAGGLILGDALVHPGQRTRLEALRVRGLEAVQIGAGAAVMLVIAALIEAFWSPAPLPNGIKYAAAAALWTLVFAYLGLAGRGGRNAV